MPPEGLSIFDSLRLASVVAMSMLLFFAAICSYYLEKRNKQPPLLALVFLLIGWCALMLGSATSGVGHYFPVVLVATPLFSGYVGPALFLCTQQLIAPHHKINYKWFLLGGFGTIHSLLALIIPDGLEPAIQSILYKAPYIHPILSPIMIIHGIQLIGFIVVSTFLITRAYISKSNPDLRRTQFWLMTICWTALVVIVFTNILPTFKVIITEIQPALIIMPIAMVGLLCIKSLGEETWTIRAHQIQERNNRMDSLGRMAKGLAHDLNNILSTILGHAEIARLRGDGQKNKGDHLDQIVFGTQRAATLIDKMLAYSGKQYAVANPVDPTKNIQTIFDSMVTLQTEGVTMQLDFTTEIPTISMDESDLESALQNLLQNGLNALENGKGRVTLRASSETKTVLPQDYVGHDISGTTSLRIEVEDTGKGMTKEEASRALEPFFSTHAKGKGLGLVNVFSSVKRAGGALWFQSEPNVGTRFVFWIPTSDAPIESRPVAQDNSSSAIRAILVEDDADVSTILITMLDSLNIVVDHFDNSEEAISAVSAATTMSYDVAILDVRLGGIDGVELGHHLFKGKLVNAILFVSGDDPGLRIKQFKGQNVLFLRKPIGLHSLNQAISQLCLPKTNLRDDA